MSIDLAQLARHPTSFTIEQTNLKSGILNKNRQAVNSLGSFHKFFIFHPAHVSERDEILKIILDAVYPSELTPCLFTKVNNTSSAFIAKGCGAAIDTLCNKYNLIIPIPDKKDCKLELKLFIQYSQLHNVAFTQINSSIAKVLQTKLVRLEKRMCVNLESFHTHKDLLQFCALYQPNIFRQIMTMVKSQAPFTFELVLKNNYLRNLEALEVIFGWTIPTLDLRNNQLQCIEDLKPIKELKEVKNLFLSGNPLCDKYDEETYVKLVRELCPKLEKLDGMVIGTGGFPAFRRNYLSNYDAFDLVHQFVERFFTVYDFSNRQLLEGLYHTNAMFSLTAGFVPDQKSSFDATLKKYMMYNRNLIALADYAKSRETLCHGVASIMKLFTILPATEHDPFSFSVDLLHYTEKCAIIMVCGVFREAPDALLDNEKILGFSRNFTLKCINNEWCIVNEMLHVYNALTSQQVRSFKNVKQLRTNVLPLPTTEDEQNKLVDSVKSITTLNLEWSKKCLEESNYDLKKCLIMFVDLYKVDKIPPEAFIETPTQSTNKESIQSSLQVTEISVPSSNFNSTTATMTTAASTLAVKDNVTQAKNSPKTVTVDSSKPTLSTSTFVNKSATTETIPAVKPTPLLTTPISQPRKRNRARTVEDQSNSTLSGSMPLIAPLQVTTDIIKLEKLPYIEEEIFGGTVNLSELRPPNWPKNKRYRLRLKTADGKSRYVTIKGDHDDNKRKQNPNLMYSKKMDPALQQTKAHLAKLFNSIQLPQ